MKKRIVFILALSCFALTACTGQESSQIPESHISQSSVVEETSGTEVQEKVQTVDTDFVSLPEDAGTLAPKNVLKNALRLTQPEVESSLGVSLSESSVNPRSGGYLADCQVSFGQVSATQVDLQFNKVNQEDPDPLLLAVGYQFSFETAEDGWNAFQAMSQEARSQGAKSAAEEYYGQESGFVRYSTFEEFDAGARESVERSGLPTVECVDRFYVDDRTTCEYRFTYAPDQGFIAAVYYGAAVTRSMDGENSLE